MDFLPAKPVIAAGEEHPWRHDERVAYIEKYGHVGNGFLKDTSNQAEFEVFSLSKEKRYI